MPRRLAILQSNYIPWKGYFDLLDSVDEFVVYDEVQFTKNDWRNRNRIKTPAGPAWLSIPARPSIDRRVCDVVLADAGWQRKHWATLEMNYRRSARFEDVAQAIRALYLDVSYATLSQANLAFIRGVCGLLSIGTRISCSTSYPTAPGRSRRLAEICVLAGCDTYVSGPSAKAYLDIAEFESRGLRVEWFEYGPYPAYPQRWGDFVHEVSILDALFNCGPDRSRVFREGFRMKLSIASTLFQSADHVREFCTRASAAAHALVGGDHEIVLVNDGSTDASLAIAREMMQVLPGIRVVDLSRNFGHHPAMLAALAHTRGELVYLLDSDLEEAPEWLSDFHSRLRQEDADVVFGVQQARRGGFTERVTGALFYRLFRFLSGLDLPSNIVVARLMTRRYVDALMQHSEREVFIAGLWCITGFRQLAQPVVKLSTSPTTYTLRKKLSQLVSSVTSFSDVPLRGIFALGCLVSLAAAIYGLYLLLTWVFVDEVPGGYTSLILSIWLLGGLNMAALGVIGMYLSKVFIEAKARPRTIVRAVYPPDGESR